MHESLVDFLRCPFCFGPIKQLTATKTATGEISYGLLNCPSCAFDYPIVAGVLILRDPDATLDVQRTTTEHVMVPGPRVREVSRALKAGNNSKALELLLNPYTLDGPVIPRPLTHWKPRRAAEARGPATDAGGFSSRLKQRVFDELKNRDLIPAARTVANAIFAPKRAAKRTLLPLWRKGMLKLLGQASDLSAVDIIDLYYRRYSKSEIAAYFTYRLAQPRHLTALCIASALQESGGLVLDLACGMGHMSHYFSYGQKTPRVIGVDREFFGLYVAKNWVAPNAQFICSHVDVSLPFADGSFDGVLCSDAFGLFLNRASAAREMLRVTRPEGLVALPRTRNSAIAPWTATSTTVAREGHELGPEEYRRLFSNGGLKCALFADATIVKQYLSRNGLDLTVDDSSNLQSSEHLSIFVSRSDKPFRRYAPFTEWPHAVGRLGVNPLYARNPVGDQVEMTLSWPTTWYKFQNQMLLDYAPEKCVMPKTVVNAIDAGQRTPEAQRFIDDFVVIGMPDRYVQA